MKFAVLASGNGSNLEAIIQAIEKKKIKAQLAVVISDREEAYALVRARKAQIPAVFIDPRKFSDRVSFDKAVIKSLKEASVDWVVLAGFMRILSSEFIHSFPNRILNIHPSLLPAFKGAHAIRDAFDYGVKVTGVTIHFVDEKVDHGEIIVQKPVEIQPQDTLATLEERIHKVEHALYPAVIALMAKGELKFRRRRQSIRK